MTNTETAEVIDSTLSGNAETNTETKVNYDENGNAIEVTPEVKPEVKPDNKASGAAELLRQRNEARREAEALKLKASEGEEAKQKLKDLEEQIVNDTLANEKKQEKSEFLIKNPIFNELEAQIDELQASSGLSYEDSARLIAAKLKPELLMDEQYRNKATANNSIQGTAKTPTNPRDFTDENVLEKARSNPDEFIKRGDEQALKERLAAGKTR